jgi:SAM-dependent methyltransferase
VRIDPAGLKEEFRRRQETRSSGHTALMRSDPSRFRYDFLALRLLADDVESLIARVPAGEGARRALDLGCDRSPYGGSLAKRGYRVETLDLTTDGEADHAGTVERTGLSDEAFDLVLCTQVLEHCDDPFLGVREIRRILRPGGHLIVSVPHVWFYHPHPADHWRFTQEGILKLCSDAGLRPVELLGQGGAVVTFAQITCFLLYGLVGRWGAPVFAALNAAAPLFDRALPNTLFCHNFACLAARDAR